jgi:hypothetical protein
MNREVFITCAGETPLPFDPDGADRIGPTERLARVEPAIDRVAEQAAFASIRELEARRDACLVAVLDAPRTQGFAAGATLGEHERRLLKRRSP